MTTKIADIIVPEVFNPYFQEKTAELTALYMGGIVSRDPLFDKLAASGGTVLKMPFFGDLDGADEVLSDAAALTPGKIGTSEDRARLQMRGRAWGVNDLSKALSGADPMRAIADRVADYWARKNQALAISTLDGVFADNAANDSGDMVHNIAIEDYATAGSLDNLISADAVIAAAGTMGDAAKKLTAIAMHSAVYQRLQSLNLIAYVRPSDVGVDVPTYLGYRVIVDDACPAVAGATNGTKYTTYLFGEGAFAYGRGEAPVPSETDRDSLAGEDFLITRQHFILHPRGIKWLEGSVAGEAPTNAECALAANWDRVYARKNVRIAKMVTNG